MRFSLSLLLFLVPPGLAATGGTIEEIGNTLVSAMMMFVGNSEKVYILDKAEGNAAQVAGHPAWGSVWDLKTNQATVMDIKTNSFCSSGHHLPNGSYVTFGGNSAVSPGAKAGSQGDNWDAIYQDFDGRKAIRLLNPCSSSDDFGSSQCQWFDNPDVLSMQRGRWYSTAEALGDGSIVIIGGFTGGGFILRNVPNKNPTDGAELTYEFFPSNGQQPQQLQFLFKTSGLNAYPLTYLLASGKVFMQANVSTMIWDYKTNTETALPDMPGGVIRVYPASGANAMLPLTPANNYAQTILFCGGTDMAEPDWGDFSYPYINTWDYPASKDCQRITPEPTDGSTPTYVKDDDMLDGRTMGQFIILPDGKLLVVNGGLNGTAGYGPRNLLTPEDQMPFGQSFAAGPVLTPAIYDPNAPKGSRWSNAGLGTSQIPRLYHSSAMLLPDGSVMIAGSNPNLDVDIRPTTIFKTTYTAEKFYPPYFSASTRPTPSGVPSTLSYGGNSFDITIPSSSYSGSSNDAAKNTIISVVRGGWTTHGMNMGQRFLQLNNTYTVKQDGSIVFHVSQMPPNSNIFQPGPAFLYVVVNGIPSIGSYVIIGNGAIGTQPVAPASVLPPSVLAAQAQGSADGSTTGNNSNANANANANNSTDPKSSTSHIGMIAGIAGGAAAVAILALVIGICIARRRRAAAKTSTSPYANAPYTQKATANDSQMFLNQSNQSQTWNHIESQQWDQGTPSGYKDSVDSEQSSMHYHSGASQYDYQAAHYQQPSPSHQQQSSYDYYPPQQPQKHY